MERPEWRHPLGRKSLSLQLRPALGFSNETRAVFHTARGGRIGTPLWRILTDQELDATPVLGGKLEAWTAMDFRVSTNEI